MHLQAPDLVGAGLGEPGQCCAMGIGIVGNGLAQPSAAA